MLSQALQKHVISFLCRSQLIGKLYAIAVPQMLDIHNVDESKQKRAQHSLATFHTLHQASAIFPNRFLFINISRCKRSIPVKIQ